MFRRAPSLALAAFACVASACGGAPVVAPESTPTTTPAPAPPAAADPWVIEGELSAEELPAAAPTFPLTELPFPEPEACEPPSEPHECARLIARSSTVPTATRS